MLLAVGTFPAAAAENDDSSMQEAVNAPFQNPLQESCRQLAPIIVRGACEIASPTADRAWPRWGAQVSTAFSKTKALAMFARLRHDHDSLLAELANAEISLLPERDLSRGRQDLYMVEIGANSRDEAKRICARLRAEGAACIVRKNDILSLSATADRSEP